MSIWEFKLTSFEPLKGSNFTGKKLKTENDVSKTCFHAFFSLNSFSSNVNWVKSCQMNRSMLKWNEVRNLTLMSAFQRVKTCSGIFFFSIEIQWMALLANNMNRWMALLEYNLNSQMFIIPALLYSWIFITCGICIRKFWVLSKICAPEKMSLSMKSKMY